MLIKDGGSNNTLAHWEKDELEWLKTCPVCGSEDSNPLHEGLTDYNFAAAGGKWRLLTCTRCQCAYLNPRPNRKTIGRAYSTYYTHSPVAAAGDTMTGVRWLRRALANGYRNYLYGTNLRPSLGRVGSAVALLSRSFRNAIDTEAAGLKGAKPKHPGSSTILDIGCGSGLALVRARDSGWRVMGIEPDPNAARATTAMGIEIIASDLSELPLRFDGTFERILLNHVIEHVHDPLAMLRRCKDLLAPGGELWLETPNLASLGHQVFGSDWRGLEPPRHLVIFESNSLVLSLREAGFTKIQISKPRDVLNYMFERSSYIRQTRIIEAGSEVLTLHNNATAVLSQLIKRAAASVAKESGRSEFLTLTASS